MPRLFRSVLLLLGVLSITVIGTANAQNCDEANKCWELLDNSDNLIIREVEPFRSSPRIFRNPMLQMQIGITQVRGSDGSSNVEDDDTIRIQFNNPVEYGGAEGACDLVLVGLAGREQISDYETIVEIPPERTTLNDNQIVFSLNVHAFCQRNNLPISSDETNTLPPPGDVIFPIDGGSPNTTFVSLVNPINPNRLAQILLLLNKIENETCGNVQLGVPPPRINDLATQIAMFILYEPNNAINLNEEWETYFGLENSFVYLQDYAAIHCLLDTTSPPVTQDFRCTPACNDGEQFVAVQTLGFATTQPLQTQGDLLSQTFSIFRVENSGSDGIEERFVASLTLPDSYTFTQAGTYRLRLAMETTATVFNSYTEAAPAITFRQNDDLIPSDIDNNIATITRERTIIIQDPIALQAQETPVQDRTVATVPLLGDLTLTQYVVLILGGMVGIMVLYAIAETTIRTNPRIFLLVVVLMIAIVIMIAQLRPYITQNTEPDTQSTTDPAPEQTPSVEVTAEPDTEATSDND